MFEQSKMAVAMCAAVLTGLLGLISSAGVAANTGSYKLYINKAQNPNNVILIQNDVTASVTHTAEGMELVIPGLDVQLRCKSTDQQADSDSCVIAIEPGSSDSGGSTGGSTGDSGGSTGGSTGDCTVTVWDDCSGSTGGSGGSTGDSGGSTGDSGGSTGDSGGSTGSTGGSTTNDCRSSGTIVCSSLDYGPGGGSAFTGTEEVAVEPGQVLVLPFSLLKGGHYGTIRRYPTSKGAPSVGLPRFWFSAEPNGKELTTGACAAIGSLEDAMNWTQNNVSYGCNVPNDNVVLYYNIAICDAPASDTRCASSSARPSNATLYLKLRGDYNPQ